MNDSNSAALVTGAASGIGRATALRLAHDGFHVCAADINEAGLDETVATVTAAGGSASAHPVDVADPQACRDLVGHAVDAAGRLDLVANVAGVLTAGRVEEHSVSDWDRLVAINLSSVFHISAAAVPHLVDTRGCIVNIASVAGLVGQAYTAIYCATKAGVVSLTKSMAVEFSDRWVRVNCICPGGVDTPLVSGFGFPDDANLGLLAPLAPLLPSIAQPEEIAAMVAYMASPDARSMTGSVVTIDGGQSAP